MPHRSRPRLLILQALGAIWAERYCPLLKTLDVDLSFVYWKDMMGRAAREVLAMQQHGEAIAVDDPAAIVDIATRYGRAKGVDGVLTFSELLLRDAAAVADALGLPHHAPAAVCQMQDKYQQRLALARGGVPVPRVYKITDEADLPAALRHVSLPAVFKPVYGFASTVTFRVDNPHQLGSIYAKARQLYSSDPRVRGAAPVFLLEELLRGADWRSDPRFGDYVSVETLVHRGSVRHLTITDKLPLSQPFRETGHVLPSSLPAARQAEILDMATRAIAALGASDGAMHTELKLTAAGPRIIEVNGRLGGGIGELLVEAGYNVVAEIGRIALGHPPASWPDFGNYTSFVMPQTPAADVVVKSISGLDAIAELPGVRRVRRFLEPGQAPEWRLGQGVIASTLLQTSSVAEMLELQRRVLSTLRVDYARAHQAAA